MVKIHKGTSKRLLIIAIIICLGLIFALLVSFTSEKKENSLSSEISSQSMIIAEIVPNGYLEHLPPVIIAYRDDSRTEVIDSGGYTNGPIYVVIQAYNEVTIFYRFEGMDEYQFAKINEEYFYLDTGWNYVYAVDKSGLSSPVYSIYYDGTEPYINVRSGGKEVASGNYTSENFSFYADDNGGSGIAEIYYMTPTSGIYQPYNSGMVINKNSGDGWYYAYCIDRAGNESSRVTVYLDTSSPVVELYRNGEKVYSKKVTASGINETDLYYNLGDTIKISCSSVQGITSSNFALNKEVTVTNSNFPNSEYLFSIKNSSGMEMKFKIHIVREQPKLIIDGVSCDSSTSMYINRDVKLNWSCDRNIANFKDSGVSIQSKDGNYNKFYNFSSPVNELILCVADNKEVSYIVVVNDVAGNESVYNIIIDKIKPQLEVTSNDSQIYSGDHVNQPFCVEMLEEIYNATYSFNGGEYTTFGMTEIFSEEGVYNFAIYDRAGNKTNFVITIDKTPPTGQLYADYKPIASGLHFNGNVYFTWDGNEETATLNGQSYMKNTVIKGDGEYEFVLADRAGNKTVYTITLDSAPPSYNFDLLQKDNNYKISKWYNAVIEGNSYAFANRSDALAFACSKEYARDVKVLYLADTSAFTQHHLIANNGDPNNNDDALRIGTYWLYKSKTNPSIQLYYFDENLLNNVITYYANNYISAVNYYTLGGFNVYDNAHESIYDNKFLSQEGFTAFAVNLFTFNQVDSTQIFAENIISGNERFALKYGVKFSEQVTISGLYLITEIDKAGNEFSYYVYLDNEAPVLQVKAEIFNSESSTNLTVTKDSLNSIAAYFYKSFSIMSINDADPWSVIAITFNGNKIYYSQGDTLPVLNVGGEYTVSVYDRLGNSYEFTLYIVGSPASISFKEVIKDNTTLEITIKLDQKFDTLVSLEIYRDGTLIENISTAKFIYSFEKNGLYKVTLRDNFGRIIEADYSFVKMQPEGVLSGVNNNGITKSDVKFEFDEAKFYVELRKNGILVETNYDGEILLTASNDNSGTYEIKLIDINDKDNNQNYEFTLNTLPPSANVTGVQDGGTTNENVTINWIEVLTVTYTLNGGEKLTLANGQSLTREGSYNIILENELGTVTVLNFTIDKSLDYSVYFGSELSKNSDTTNKTINLTNAEPLNISVLKNGEDYSYTFNEVLSEEGVYRFFISDSFNNSTTFSLTIDRTVLFTSNIGNGLICNEDVTISAEEKLTITGTKDGALFEYDFGTKISEEGNYKFLIQDLYNNEKSYSFQIVKQAKKITKFSLGEEVNIISIYLNDVLILSDSNQLDFNADGNYEITAESEGKTYSFTLTIDTTAPTIDLYGVKHGGVSGEAVTISNLSEEAAIEVFFDGEIISYELGQTLSEYGKYRVVVTDLVGNSSEYNFTLKHVLNGGAIALIFVAILLAAAMIIAIIFTKRGLFKRKPPVFGFKAKSNEKEDLETATNDFEEGNSNYETDIDYENETTDFDEFEGEN